MKPKNCAPLTAKDLNDPVNHSIQSVACAVRTDLWEAAELVVRMAHATRVIFDGSGLWVAQME